MFNYFNKTKQVKNNAIDNAFVTRVSNIAIEFLTQHGFTGIEFSKDAPNSLSELQSMYKFRKAEKMPFLVYCEGNENTIYGSAYCNGLARAWHDICHIILDAEFDAEGEKKVTDFQKSFLIGIDKKIIDIEINGQVKYYEKNGKFPENQLDFFRFSLAFGIDQACTMC